MVTSDHVLKELNRFRAEHWDLEPLEEMPKGRICCSQDCPVARSLPENWSISGRYAYDPTLCDQYLLPEALIDFVWDFDDGEYPHLIER